MIMQLFAALLCSHQLARRVTACMVPVHLPKWIHPHKHHSTTQDFLLKALITAFCDYVTPIISLLEAF